MQVSRISLAVCVLLMTGPELGRADGLDGVWRSLGYGQVLAIAGDSVDVYQEVGGRILESRIEKARREGTRLQFEIVPWDYRSEFAMSLAGDMLALSEFDTGREIVFQRLEKLPPETVRTNDPKSNLDYLLSMFSELYPAFEDRNVDWEEVVRQARSKADRKIDDEQELFAICKGVLDGIGRDGHVGITGPDGERYSPARALAGPMLASSTRERHMELIRHRYLEGPVRETANGKIIYGHLANGVGYINVLAVEGMAADPSLQGQREALDASLDELWRAFYDTRELILDLRHNGGGFDALSLMVAGLFADSEYIAFSKRARIQGTGRFTEPRLFHVAPREQSLAAKPLRILTGPGTASGAEILVMATLQFPHARRLGAPTMGILSDTILRELPNGWQVRLYSERYFAFDGEAFEGIGIAPDEFIELSLEHLDDSRDPVLEAASGS